MMEVDNLNCYIIMTTAEFQEAKKQLEYHIEMLRSLGTIRYSKAEQFKDCILGTIRVPQKNDQKKALFSFGFYLTKSKLYLVEDEGSLKSRMAEQTEMLKDINTPSQLFFHLLEHMIDEDTLYLSHMESEIDKLEEEICKGLAGKNFFMSLTRHRQKFSEFNIYYEQLMDIAELLSVCDFYPGEQEKQSLQRFMHRIERLQNHVHLLRENLLQIRELYQSLQDARQNKIMVMITVVTTIFLPLTLITGWYGMNFVYMPELNWKYGYLTVIAMSVIIVFAEIFYFKKKKFI